MNDAERLSRDPALRLIGSEKIWDRGAALPSRLQTFETELLAEEGNFAGLARLNRELIGKAEALGSTYRTVLDMDSTEIPVYGEQEQSAYNGHFESTCYHPLLLFNREGDCLAAKLRPGNVHSAEGWEELLLPEIERQQRMSKEVAFRASLTRAENPSTPLASVTRARLPRISPGRASAKWIWLLPPQSLAIFAARSLTATSRPVAMLRLSPAPFLEKRAARTARATSFT